MLFTRQLVRSYLRNYSTNFKDQLPKDWVKAAEKELKGAPFEELTWRTSEVKGYLFIYINTTSLLGNRFETNLHGRGC